MTSGQIDDRTTSATEDAVPGIVISGVLDARDAVRFARWSALVYRRDHGKMRTWRDVLLWGVCTILLPAFFLLRLAHMSAGKGAFAPCIFFVSIGWILSLVLIRRLHLRDLCTDIRKRLDWPRPFRIERVPEQRIRLRIGEAVCEYPIGELAAVPYRDQAILLHSESGGPLTIIPRPGNLEHGSVQDLLRILSRETN